MLHSRADIHCSMEKVHAGAGEKCEKERVSERNHYVLAVNLPPSPPLLAAPLKGVSVTCGDNKGGGARGEESGVKLSLGKGKSKCVLPTPISNLPISN